MDENYKSARQRDSRDPLARAQRNASPVARIPVPQPGEYQ